MQLGPGLSGCDHALVYTEVTTEEQVKFYTERNVGGPKAGG